MRIEKYTSFVCFYMDFLRFDNENYMEIHGS